MPSFITMWVKAWKRESSLRPARTLQPLRDLLASWVGGLVERLVFRRVVMVVQAGV